MLLEFVFHVILCSVLCTIIHVFFHKKHDKCAHDFTEEEMLKIKAWLATEPTINSSSSNVVLDQSLYANVPNLLARKTSKKSCCQR